MHIYLSVFLHENLARTTFRQSSASSVTVFKHPSFRVGASTPAVVVRIFSVVDMFGIAPHRTVPAIP